MQSVQNRIVFSFVLFVFLFSFAGISEASSFGSLAKTEELTLFVDESKSFDLLFWSSDGSKYNVVIDVIEFPKDVTVLVNPNNFPIDLPSNERVSMSDGSYVNAVPVKVFVKSEGAVPGEHTIKLSARTVPSEGIVVFSQERIFDLKINVIGPSVSQTVNENVIIEESEEVEIIETEEDEESPQETNYLLYLIAGVGILSVAYVIYRYA